MANRPIIYIDMDHTFCDFAAHREVWSSFATTETENKFPWSMRGFFESIPPMPGAIDYWHSWSGAMDLYFLTRPSLLNRHSYSEKANWVYKHLGQSALDKLILSPQKDLLIGDVLIDDYGGNGQSTFGGEWWQFGSEGCRDWRECHDRTVDFMDRIRSGGRSFKVPAFLREAEAAVAEQ